MSKPVLEDLFVPSGRRNRKSFLLLNLLAFAGLVVFLVVAAVLSAGMDGGGSVRPGNGGSIHWPVFLGAFGFTAVTIFAGAQRWRDMGYTGWLALLFFAPYVGNIAYLFLFFMPGNAGENKYGPDPLA